MLTTAGASCWVGETGRRARARHHGLDLLRLVLGDLGTGRMPGGQRQGGAAEQQGGGYSIGVSHGGHVLRCPSFAAHRRTCPGAGFKP
jgi:hypothetical protein